MAETEQPLSSDQAKGPEKLQRLMLLTASIAMVLIVSLSGVGIYQINSEHILRTTEMAAADLAEATVAMERQQLLQRQTDGTSVLEIKPESFQKIDASLRTFLAPFDIVKIKIYSPTSQVLYSTDPDLIGKVDRTNERLQRALAGLSDSHLKTTDEIVDLAMEKKFNIDVVETYVPIMGGKNQIVGCFEIYTDVTVHRQEIAYTVTVSILVITVILLLVFSLAFVILRMGSASLREAQRQLQTMASTDPLTGAFNHREILLRAKKELSRSRRPHGDCPPIPMGLIMLDVDHFKLVNDTLGHPAGDEVLKELVLRSQTALRTYDLFGRYGGEEFLVLLPETPLEGTRRTAERIRAAIRSKPFHVENHDVRITVSLGIAESWPDETTIDPALKRADNGLYSAKKEGRDRIGCDKGTPPVESKAS